jgi:voltage-gated potassium channel Kch
MDFSPPKLVALITATSFAAGLNLYATLATLGLLARFNVIPLPPQLSLISSWWVIGISAVLFAVEFFADKIPAFDLVWNALHTFIRIPVAALIAYRATAGLSPTEQMLTATAGAVIALAAHGGKTAVRAAVTPSPEPFSNMALSTGEDALAIFLTWFATKHPYWAAGIVGVMLVIIVLLLRWVVRSLRSLFRGAEEVVAKSEAPS